MANNNNHAGHVHTSAGFGKGDLCCSAEDAKKITDKANEIAKANAKATTNGEKN